MRVIITNLVWIELAGLNELAYAILTSDLLIQPISTSSFNLTPNPIRLYSLTDKWIGVPRAYYFARKPTLPGFRDVVEDDRSSKGRTLSRLETIIKLREEDQEPDVQKVVSILQQKKYGMFEAYTSYGKTISAFEIIKRLGLNTIILMHRESLIDQWIRSAKKFAPHWSIGLIKAGKCDYEGKDLVFATIQSLMGDAGNKYPVDIWSYFGTIIVDEVHVVGAEKFGSVAPKFNCRYYSGLSGTIRRADKCEKVFKYVLGEVIHKATEVNRIRPLVFPVETGYSPKFISSDWEKPKLLALITESKQRNRKIAVDVIKALEKGRRPLIMSERLAMLENISKEIEILSPGKYSHGFYIGGKKEKELIEASEKNIVYATMQLAKEGVDVPELDTLFLASPVAEVEQATGRVVRHHPDKKKPMVIDYVDTNVPRFKSLFLSRYRLYKRIEFEVIGAEKLGL